MVRLWVSGWRFLKTREWVRRLTRNMRNIDMSHRGNHRENEVYSKGSLGHHRQKYKSTFWNWCSTLWRLLNQHRKLVGYVRSVRRIRRNYKQNLQNCQKYCLFRFLDWTKMATRQIWSQSYSQHKILICMVLWTLHSQAKQDTNSTHQSASTLKENTSLWQNTIKIN